MIFCVVGRPSPVPPDFALVEKKGRKIFGALLMIGVIVVTFMLTRLLPGDPAAYFAGLAASPQAIAEIRTKLGLDRSLPEQFVAYLGDLIHGNLGNSLSTGQPVVGKEKKLVGRDGHVLWVSITRMPLRDKDERIIGTFGVSRDITNLKRAEQALRESEQRWRTLTETLPQLVWTATPDGACDYFSTQWTQHTGVPESDLLGWRWLEVLHPDDRQPTRKLWADSVAGRGTYDVEYRVRRSDGEYRWFKARSVPIRDSAHALVKWYGANVDVDELKRAERAAVPALDGG